MPALNTLLARTMGLPSTGSINMPFDKKSAEGRLVLFILLLTNLGTNT